MIFDDRTGRFARRLALRRATKFNAAPVAGYGSRAEAQLGAELHLQEAAGEIAELKEHPRWLLLEANPPDRAVYWVPDFQCRLPTGQLVVIEYKGVETRDFVMRRKLFRLRYPWIELRVVYRGGLTRIYAAKGLEPAAPSTGG